MSLLVAAVGCGDNLPGPMGGDNDAAPPDAEEPFAVCGDGLISGNEECDDDNTSEDDECLNDCTLACGDGVVNAIELCDTGIPAGMPGACPTDCDDSDECTADALSGDSCQTECLNMQILAPMDGDMCCPPGQDANTDSDCTSICGNGVVESGETCDTAIAAGMPGACPDASACDDGAVCTSDALDFAGTCSAVCSFTDITAPANGDGCCPPGADVGTDNDCSPMCGDGVFTPADELCDIAIPAGMPGACPQLADCADMDSCTIDSLTGDGTCDATCTNTPITTTDDTDSDMCCPPSGNANNDIDCMPVCGNGALEPGEQCDDGNVVTGDGCNDMCTLEPTAFRIDSLQLRDPHPFVLVFIIICTDVTDQLNTQIGDAMVNDVDSNGFLDFSVVNVFRPLDQTGASTPMDIVFGDCTAPAGSTSCSQPGTPAPISSTATNMAMGTCLEPLAGTTSGYNPPVTNTVGPCYVSDPEDLTIDLGGILVPLTDAQIAATYVGSPATSLVNGLLKGFISEADAQTIIVDIPMVGTFTLAELLPGGMGNCDSGDDRDTGPDGVTVGWWLHLNFTATAVPWTSP